MMRHILVAAMAVSLLVLRGHAGRMEDRSGLMVNIPSGSYEPFYRRESEKITRASFTRARSVSVEAFQLDRYPVTNREFISFVKNHPQWRRSNVLPIFADAHYLTHWASDLSLAHPSDNERPVTNVSWFAAQAYCKAEGKMLPTTDQWEYVLADRGINNKAVRAAILAWYGRPATQALPVVQASAANSYRISGLVGLIWEWTLDFNSVLSGSDTRGSDARFCGGGSLGVTDPGDYASFMRYSMRASLKASYTTKDLGFRCAKNAR